MADQRAPEPAIDMTKLSHLSLLLLAGAAGAAGGLLEHALEGGSPASAERVNVPSPEVAELRREVSALEARVEELTRIRARGPDTVAASPGATTGAPEPDPRAGAVAASRVEEPAPGTPSDSAAAKDALAGILGHKYGYEDARSLFHRLSLDHDAIQGTIDRLEAEIAKNPSADLYATLATAYSAKTAYATPPGPEQGVVWAKAEKAFDEAIRLDPEHWQARYGQAFGDSMAPEFVGLRPRAIREFEELVEIQERKPLAPEHAEVYVRLGTLYKDAGNVKKARETWQRGRERFPDDKRFAEAIALTEER
ncbi:MAG TPA: hypothetical protein VFY93_08750 [Planctomycetota bacterium]|nr:hypothetical protein [Planctomycetota bacterium]